MRAILYRIMIFCIRRVQGVQYLDYKVLVQILRETEKQETNTYFP